MTVSRIIEAGLLALVAVVTGGVLVSLQYDIVADAGGAEGGFLWPLALIPLGAAALSVRHTSWGRAAKRAGMVVFTVALVVAQVAAFTLAARAYDRYVARVDRTFACFDPQIDSRVDATFHAFPHPAPLYVLMESDGYGCTAAIYGSAEDTFGPWRDVLVSSDWTVAENADRVRVTHGDLEAVLYRDGDTALLRITANEPAACEQTPARADESDVVAC